MDTTWVTKCTNKKIYILCVMGKARGESERGEEQGLDGEPRKISLETGQTKWVFKGKEVTDGH